MNLVLDIGNTMAKLAVFQNYNLLERQLLGNEELSEKIPLFLSRHPKITQIVLSSVVARTFSFHPHLPDGLFVLELSAQTPLPFKNKYATPHTLGNDRKALIAAAVHQYPGRNVLVIDAGTCITYDFKNAEEEFLGGGISPGLKMRFLALNTFTAQLPLVTVEQEVPLIGNSTVHSIQSGVVNGISMEVEGIINSYSKRYENLIIIITGGDAQILSINIKNGIFANSNFLLEGLNYILEFNNN